MSSGEWRERWLPRVAPILLVALAGIQIALAFGVGLSPWKGGGFGMFASTDHSGFRRLVAVSITEAGESPLRVPGELDRARRAVRLFPTESRLHEIARALSATAPLDTRRIRVRVERGLFEGPELAPRWEPIASVEHVVDAAP
ncbi:MAG: hypothetical protein QNK05_02450 [Myxococcota bacterium]|nr:hypothetical protein [Myxococcota bacterium]